jgi:hypothetical protein
VAQDLGDHASFSAVVLYSGPADGAYLIGPGVSRSIQFTAADPNGGVASASWRVEVQNRAPRVASSFPSLTVPHFFDAPNSRYMTVNTLAFFVDDDGDPLFVEAASPNLTCSASLAGQAAEVLCTAPYSGTPAANAISGLRAVATTARDPWASASASTTLNVTNRSPRLTAGAVGIPPTCTQGSCCLIDPETKRCVEYRFSQGVSSTTIPPPVIDDDGDPLLIDYAAGGGCLGISHGSDICAPGSCRDLGLSLCGAPSTCGGTSTSGTVSVYATDGDSPFSGSFAVGTGCP